ncbi:MAG: hypothetical protein ACT4R6_11565 [Gemmatimonadaceae bacterium]
MRSNRLSGGAAGRDPFERDARLRHTVGNPALQRSGALDDVLAEMEALDDVLAEMEAFDAHIARTAERLTKATSVSDCAACKRGEREPLEWATPRLRGGVLKQDG